MYRTKKKGGQAQTAVGGQAAVGGQTNNTQITKQVIDIDG